MASTGVAVAAGGGFWKATGRSLAMTLVSEFGDETFIMAALLAMRYPKMQVLGGALAALYLMTFLSAMFGWFVPKLLSPKWTHRIATVMFFFFAARLFWIGYTSSDSDAEEEVAEIEKQLGRKSRRTSRKSSQSKRLSSIVEEPISLDVEEPEAEGEPTAEDDEEASISSRRRSSKRRSSKDSVKRVSRRGSSSAKRFWGMKLPKEARRLVEQLNLPRDWDSLKLVLEAIFTAAFVEAFMLTFFAEWGDRSQVATITLASGNNPFGVFLGGVLGHSVCSSVAVVGGALIATQVSQRAVAFAGSALFLIFGIVGLFSFL